MRAPWAGPRAAVRTRLSVLALLGATACVVPLHPATGAAGVAMPDDAAPYTRRLRPATNLEIEATLWDRGWVDAAATQLAASADPDEAERRAERWRERYLESQTTFTVVRELANRPATSSTRRRAPGPRGADHATAAEGAPHAGDPLVDPRAWTFRLDRGTARNLAPRRIEVQAVDRFPTRAGGYHYRIAYAVFFDGPPLDERPSAASGARGVDPQPLELRVRPLVEDRGRAGLGPSADERGYAITWWVAPVLASR